MQRSDMITIQARYDIWRELSYALTVATHPYLKALKQELDDALHESLMSQLDAELEDYDD